MASFKHIHFYVLSISAFARAKAINEKDAYNYLEKYKAINFLEECFDAQHCLSLDDTVDDLTAICKNNGGTIG